MWGYLYEMYESRKGTGVYVVPESRTGIRVYDVGYLRVEMVQVYMCGAPESRNGTGVYAWCS